MAVIFPDNPTIGDTVITGGRTWRWDGERWLKYPDTGYRGSAGYFGSTGFTGSRGDKGPTGDPGSETGYDGSRGYNGSTGYTGSMGIMGPAGAPTDVQFFVGDGSTGQFTTSHFIASENHVFVMVNGLVQMPGIDYSILDNDTIDFANIPSDGSDIEVRFFDAYGYTGSTGFAGSVGDSGPVGYRGSAGADGEDGVVGYQGSTGDPGGDTGYTGSEGFTGSKGDTGFVGSQGAGGAPRSNQTFVGDGTTTLFRLNVYITNTKQIFVMVNGLVMLPDIDYYLSDGDLIFYNPPDELADIEVRYFGDSGYIGSTGYRGSAGFRGSAGETGFSVVWIDDDPPLDPVQGTLWWDTDNGILNIFYYEEQTWVGIAEGPRGPRGYAGSIGGIGFTGSQGIPGEAAAVGYTGSQGETGFDGSRGLVGFAGSQGIPGEFAAVGYDGSRGDTGYAGSRGFAGSLGVRGYAGSIGETGYTGSYGYVGSIGYAGSQGIPGEYAAVGYTGSVGSPGGYAGSQGPDGVPGAPGPRGYAGSVGYDGSKGDPGSPEPLNYSQNTTTAQSIGIGGVFPKIAVSTDISANGNPILVTMTGDIDTVDDKGTCSVQLYRDNTPIGIALDLLFHHQEENKPVAMHYIDTPSAGDYSYSFKVTNTSDTLSVNAVITAIELTFSGYVGGGGGGGTGFVGSVGYTGSQGVPGTGGGGGAGLLSRETSSATATSVVPFTLRNISIPFYKGYLIYKVSVSGACWVRFYASEADRTADASRDISDEPNYNSGVILELVTTGSENIKITPAVAGYIDGGTSVTMPVTGITGGNIPVTVVNRGNTPTNITIQIEGIGLEV